ncbi:uncharacterized protein G2W53_026147 [Senna tora]|uniref:Uncharacterized protein n=1 Tax=Senna tora TaxID=362788 RepID=A0A834TEI3_9FABA|nr:uncharacterized protein G2W53_026147 [Senna tora]
MDAVKMGEASNSQNSLKAYPFMGFTKLSLLVPSTTYPHASGLPI